MKSLFYGLLAVCMILTSCQKEELVDISNENLIVDNSFTKEKRKFNHLRVYYDNGGNEWGCKDSGGSCLPDVIVTPLIQEKVVSLLTSIGSKEEERNVFNENYNFFTEIFGSTLVDKVINDELFTKFKSREKEIYVHFVRSAVGEVVNTIPVKSE